MPVNTSEANFETLIERALVERHGYLRRAPSDYDRGLCLDPELALRFVQATQPAEWARYTKQYPLDARFRLTERLARLIERQGTLYALREELKDSGCHFRLAYFRPNTALNPDQQERYTGNLFSVIRQLRYRPEGEASQPELDLVLFLNGLPLFTAELKNQLTGQNVGHAIEQYRRDRPSGEPLFKLGRCLAHFGVDDQLVYVTPHLQDAETQFLPFNLGHNHGAGNPSAGVTSGRFATSYLWEEIWSGDSVLNLVQRFIHLFDVLDEDGKKTGQKRLIYPRYHQLTAVRALVAHAREHGAGQRYLVQHSAGSGKTMTISWLAHQLSVLHDEQDQPIFDTVVVVSDRRVLDRQLQQAVRSFEKRRGVVQAIDKNSEQLRQALEAGRRIIVTTLQKFPVIARKVGDLPGARFAVIVDEAHSSQSGASTQALNRALSAGSLEEAATAEEGEVEDMEDVLVREMALRRHLPNVSTFAFTATPKAKTLQLFGTRGADGKPRPFSLYPMRQAIEEGFILDVLEHYTTYKSYWRLVKTIADDPQYDRAQAQRQLRNMVELSDHAIEAKVAIMIEHFSHTVAHRIAGRAKAMIVTRSRLHAVRYKLAVDAYLREHQYPFRALVAFSGTVKDGGVDYTETGMNTRSEGARIPQTATAETFKKPAYRFLIVANKFQTGFDQPLLHTMYVDKKLGGVGAVQTLSRLNRQGPPEKHETMVLDFANEADHIRRAFEPYYETTLLSQETDPNVLYQLQAELDEVHVYDEDDVDAFAETYFRGKNVALSTLYALLDPVVGRVSYIHRDEREQFHAKLDDFCRLYAFLAQILPFAETDWEKRFHFYRLLERRLPVESKRLPDSLREQVEVDLYRTRQTYDGQIELERGDTELPPVGPGGGWSSAEEEKDPLSVIIQELNQIYSIQTNGDTEAAIGHLQGKLAQDATLKQGAVVNPQDTFRLLFDQIADRHFAEMVDAFYRFYAEMSKDPQAKQRFFDWLFEQYREQDKND